ncbi:MAG: PMT-2 domain-containing protein [Clostridium sp.]|jgi:hypothetical protein
MEITNLLNGVYLKKRRNSILRKNKIHNNNDIHANYYKIIMAIGITMSLLWVIFVNSVPFSDFSYYYNMAVNIANGGTWGDTYTSIGYSIVLGGIFKLFGASVFKAKIFNIVLTFINYLLFKSILYKLDLSEIDRRVIFAMFVFIPNNIFYNSILGTELIFTAILLAATNLYMGSMKFKYILIGILAGLNTMIKPFFIIFFFLIFLVDIIKNRKLLSSIKNSLIVLLFTAIVISPWIYRNSKLMGEFTYVSNNGGIVLYINNNSQNDKGRWMPAEDVENSIVKTKAYKNANMTEKNKMLSAEAKKWIKAHPMEFIDLGFKRLFNTYFVGDDVGYSIYGSNISYNLQKNIIKITNLIRRVIFGIGIISILVYSIVILMLIIKGKTDILNRFNVYSVILFFMFTCVYFITEGQGRYSFPIIFVFVYWFYNVLKYIYFLKLQFTNTD